MNFVYIFIKFLSLYKYSNYLIIFILEVDKGFNSFGQGKGNLGTRIIKYYWALDIMVELYTKAIY